jgi:hypothetical protein
MNMQSASGLAMVIGFVIVVIASSVGPGKVYAERDPAARLEIIAQERGRWVSSNVLFALGGLVTALGLVLLASHSRSGEGGSLAAAAAMAYGLGSVAWAIYLAQRTIDPGSYLYTEPMPAFLAAFGALPLVGLGLFGLAWLRLGVVSWLGYLTAAGAALIALGWVLFPAQFYASFPPQLLYLFTLIGGIALVRS